MSGRNTVVVVLILILVCNAVFVISVSNSVENKVVGDGISYKKKGDDEFIKSRFAGGDGSKGNPYQISNVAQLQDMNLNFSAHYILVNDIDASDTVNWNGGKGYEPIGRDMDPHTGGYQGTSFGGSMDGQGNRIANLFINRSEDYVGLFGCIGSGSIIKDLFLSLNITGDNYMGGLTAIVSFGTMDYCGRLLNCYIDGSVRGGSVIGGLVAYNQGRINNCHTTCDVIGRGEVGGLVGWNVANGIINNCRTTGSVTGVNSNSVGGLVGRFSDGTVNNCCSTGNVRGYNNVGGLIGRNYGDISNCYSTGNVNGYEDVGGLLGSGGKIENCYATGCVSGEYDVGGLIGSGGGVESSFWDMETSGVDSSDGGTGKTTVEMQTKSTFTDVGWDFFSVWNIIEDSSYPYLRSFDYMDEITHGDEFTFEDDMFRTKCNATNRVPGNPPFSWQLSTNAGDWLQIDENGVLEGIPRNDDVGSYWVDLTAFLNIDMSDSINFNLTVYNVNSDPEITTTPTTVIYEDNPFQKTYVAIDIDPTFDLLSWSFKSNATFLTFDPFSGNLSGTPRNSDVGEFWCNVSVEDDKGGADYINHTMTVINTNDAPEITTDPIFTSYEDELYYLDWNATDIDPTADLLLWSFKSNTSFLTLDILTGNLSGIPDNYDIGVWWVNVTVYDGNFGRDSINYTLTVINTNDAPLINSTAPDIDFDEDTTYYGFKLNDVFRDIDGDELDYLYDTSGNITIEILPNSAVLFTPIKDWCGTERITFYANDSREEINVTIDITVSPANDAPTNASITLENNTYYEGGQQPAYGNAVDVDLPYGDRLRYKWTFNSTDNTRSGKEVNLSLPVGKHLITLIVSDLKGASTEISREITILAISVPDEIETPVEPDGNETGDEESSSGAMIYVGIGGAILAVVLIIAVLAFFFLRKRPSKDGEQKKGVIVDRTDGTMQSGTVLGKSLQEKKDMGGTRGYPPAPPPVPSLHYPAPPHVGDLRVATAVQPEKVPVPTTPVPASLPALSPPSGPAPAALPAAEGIALADSLAPVEPQLPACFLCGQPGTYYPEYTGFWCETCQQWLQ